MKKIIGIVLVAVLVALTFPNVGAAQGESEEFAIGLSAGVATSGDPYSNVEADSGPFAGVSLSYMFIPHLGMELGVSRYTTTWKLSSIEMGDLSVTPVTLAVQYRILPDRAVCPYLELGVAYLINSFDTSSEYRSRYSRDIDVDNSPGWIAGAGVEFDITNGFFLNLHAKYLSASAGVKETAGSVSVDQEDASVNAVLVGVGARYRF